jgi:O-antigen/teichoic acid export membrane protein
MIGAMRAAVMLGGSSIVAILMTLATAKGLAILVGPRGVGEFALLQSAVDLAVLLAGLGISVSLVRLLADALGRGDPGRVTAIRTASAIVVWTTGGVATLGLIVFRDAIAQAIFGTRELGGAVVVAALAVPFTLGAAVNIAALSAFREVGAIASLRTAAVIVMAVATLGGVLVIADPGVAIGILASALGLWLGASGFLRLRTSSGAWPGRPAVAAAITDLIRLGIPFAGSSVVGTGVQLALPILAALILGTEAAGYYRAATQISAGYLTFIAAAMLQDYYPRLSGEQARPDMLVALIDQQLKLVMILTLPLILVGIALSSQIVPLLYSPAFEPAVGILGWQLVGTLLRLPSWTLSFAILARGRGRVYFAVELVGGVVLVAASLVGMDRLGLAGLGVAVLLTYAVYYPLVWIAVRRDLPLRVTRAQRALITTTALALAIQVLPAVHLGSLQAPLSLALAMAWVGIAIVAASRILRRRFPGAAGAPGEGDRRSGPPSDAIEPGRLP